MSNNSFTGSLQGSVNKRSVSIVLVASLLIIGMGAVFAGGAVAEDTSDDQNQTTISTGAMPGDTIEERSEQRQLLAGVGSSTDATSGLDHRSPATVISTGAMPGDTIEERSHQRQLIAGVAGLDDGADRSPSTTISTGSMPGDTIEERSEQRQLLAGVDTGGDENDDE